MNNYDTQENQDSQDNDYKKWLYYLPEKDEQQLQENTQAQQEQMQY